MKENKIEEEKKRLLKEFHEETKGYDNDQWAFAFHVFATMQRKFFYKEFSTKLSSPDMSWVNKVLRDKFREIEQSIREESFVECPKCGYHLNKSGQKSINLITNK